MTEASNQTPGAGRVGTLSRQVISALNLPIKNETPIYLGETNIDHMKRRHPAEQAPPGGKVRCNRFRHTVRPTHKYKMFPK